MDKQPEPEIIDIYQGRYKAHQQRKKLQLLELMKLRYSERIFSDKPVEPEKIQQILDLVSLAPSSCNRHAIQIKVIESRDDKQLLSGLLVGGVGWLHRAAKIFLLFGDRFAYKENVFYMPYIDAGVLVMTIYMICTELGLACCYVNPNIRVAHDKYFYDAFVKDDDKLYCGALAIGYKDGE